MDQDRIVAVIMAGGEGTRFWPRSRKSKPKQFLSFEGDKSLLQGSVERLEGLVRRDQTVVITGREHVDLVRETTGLDPRCVVGEPYLRDTAACVGLGALLAESIREDAVMVVLCADHLISPTGEFQEVLERAAELAAQDDVLVTIGLRPDRPAVGYGYIETDGRIDDRTPIAREVVRFREKPDLETARRFVLAGKFLWNSGMLAFRPRTVLEAMRVCSPSVLASLESISDPWNEKDVAAAYAEMTKVSFDVAVLEQAPNKVVIEANFEWDDLGTFEGVARHAENKMGDGNIARGRAFLRDCKKVLVDNGNDGLVVVSGVDDVLVVRTKDVVLVVPRSEAENVKAIVNALESEGLGEYL